MYFDGAAARSIPEIYNVELPSQPLASLPVRTPQVKSLSMFGIAITVVVVVLKKLFYKK